MQQTPAPQAHVLRSCLLRLLVIPVGWYLGQYCLRLALAGPLGVGLPLACALGLLTFGQFIVLQRWPRLAPYALALLVCAALGLLLAAPAITFVAASASRWAAGAMGVVALLIGALLRWPQV